MSTEEATQTEATGESTATLTDAVAEAANNDSTQQVAATEEKQGETKDTQEATETGAPAEYEAFTLPDGWTISDEDLSAFGEVARDMDLNQEQGQKLVDFFVKIEETRAGQLGDGLQALKQQAESDERAGWAAELQKDSDLGAKQQNITALEQSGLLQKEFVSLLVDTGWFSRPAVVNQLSALGALLKENATPTNDGNTPTGDGSDARGLFDKSGHDA